MRISLISSTLNSTPERRAEAPGDIAAGWGPEDQHAEEGEHRTLNCSLEAHYEEIPRRVHVVLQVFFITLTPRVK